MRLIITSPRRLRPVLDIGHLHRNSWMRCSVASITTDTSNTGTTNTANARDPSAEFNIGEYMKHAKEKIRSQQPKLIIDSLSPTPSHLLNLALSEQLPKSCHPPDFLQRLRRKTATGSLETDLPPHSPFEATPLPQGHHLVYFPLQVPPSGLMPDGTDKDHYPGWPFTRRMWAGGSVTFANTNNRDFVLDGRRVHCIEKLGQPIMSPNQIPGQEKVFIDIRRQYEFDKTLSVGSYPEALPHRFSDSYAKKRSTSKQDPPKRSNIVISETRRLVFMRKPATPVGEQTHVVETAVKARKPTTKSKPDFAFEFTPDQTFLFQFSALTYNAHAIHLDTNYAKNVEGYKGLLVHGPLTLLLMLSCLRSQCKHDNMARRELPLDIRGEWMVGFIDYRNLRPLYAGETMRVCMRLARSQEKVDTEDVAHPASKKWSVWIEGPDGRLAVKATAITTLVEPHLTRYKVRENAIEQMDKDSGSEDWDSWAKETQAAMGY